MTDKEKIDLTMGWAIAWAVLLIIAVIAIMIACMKYKYDMEVLDRSVPKPPPPTRMER